MNLSVSAVEGRLRRAKAGLRKQMSEFDTASEDTHFVAGFACGSVCK